MGIRTARFVNSPGFARIVDEVFKKADKNLDGNVDLQELTLAMATVHFKVAQKCPGVMDPPSAEKIEESLSKYDLDLSGGLDKDEFLTLSKKWFNDQGALFLRKIVLNSIMSMVVLPETSGLLRREIPMGRLIPKKLFAVLFGVGEFSSFFSLSLWPLDTQRARRIVLPANLVLDILWSRMAVFKFIQMRVPS
jgi:hypothetical protein